MATNILYYRRSIHEFNTLIAPLSLVEVGAFTKLIDYLILHQTLPNSERKYFLLNIRKKPERKALDFVINEFCFVNDNGDLESEISNEIIGTSIQNSIKATINGQKGNKKLAEIRNKNVPYVASLERERERELELELEIEKEKEKEREQEQEQEHAPQQNTTATDNSEQSTQTNSLSSVGDGLFSNSVASVANTATQICIDLRQQGLAQVNPTNPKLQRAVELGATSAMFCNAYKSLKQQNKQIKNPFPYLIAMVINQITEAQAIARQTFSTRNPTKFTQQQKSDIVARMSNLEITNRELLPVLLEKGFTPELHDNGDFTYTLLTIPQMLEKLNHVDSHYNEKVIDVTTFQNHNGLFEIAE